MLGGDSVLDVMAVARARRLLEVRPERDPLWPALLAALLLALTSVLFAAVAVVAPPVSTEHVVPRSP